MQKKLISVRLHRVLPFVYLGGGVLTLFAMDTAMGYASGLLLVAAGVVEWARRGPGNRPAQESGARPPAPTPPIDESEAAGKLMTIRWRRDYECGHPVIDDQHRALFDISNDLINSVLLRKSKSDIELLLRELVEHIQHHFSTEEEVLARTRYPLTAAHREIHRVLLARAGDLEERYRAGLLAVGDLVGFISCEVISAHIITEDIKFALQDR